MRTLIIHCDKCGAKVETDKHVVRIETGSLRTHNEGVDLCRPCVLGLLGWLRAELPAEVEPIRDRSTVTAVDTQG